MIVFIVGIGFYLIGVQNKPFNETKFYFVCAKKSKNVKELENMVDELKKVGGSGKIYKHNVYNYLIINIYLNEEYAKVVLSDSLKKYPSAEILELKTKKLKSRMKLILKKEELAYLFIKKFNAQIDDILNLALRFLSQEMSENELCSKLFSLKFDIEQINDKINDIDDAEIKNIIRTNISLMMVYYSNFINSFFGSDKKNSILCEFCVNLVVLKLDLFNNL